MYKQKGLSLVELMISVVLGLILMTGVMNIFVSSKVVFSTQQALSRIQETGRLAIDFIARDVRMVGYYGGTRNKNPLAFSIANAPATVGLNGDFNVSIKGYDNSTGVDVGVLPAGVTIVEDASVLVVRAASQQGLTLNKDNTKSSLFAYTTATAKDSSGCVGTICEQAAVLVADANKALVFQVNSLGFESNTVVINHTPEWGGDSANPLTMFGLGAEIMPINTTVYFLATGAGGSTSLYQKTNNSNALELLEGVEGMRVTYAISKSDQYLTAAGVATNWANVQSVKVELLVSSLEDNVIDQTQKYEFAGIKDIDPEDRRLRKVFTTSIATRSRMVFN